ncbi:hypothetical protein BHE74_00024365 [Ensete ventricosum]|nr:hypothetical protein BHE74_00024365 [Ensete ventricosum]
MSSGASDPTLGGCVSTSPTLGMQWSPGPSSSSWASLSSTPPTLSFPASSPAMRGGLILPHLYHRPILPLSLCLHSPLRPQLLPLPQ